MLLNILKNILSIQYEYRNIYKISVITILGIKIKFKKIDNKKLYEEILKLKSQNLCTNKLLNLFTTPSKCVPAKGTLRKKQEKILYVLKTIKNLCEENNFIYWLDCGTLLGAVRHKGFIPWDCDGDISMLRDDYLKLIPILKKIFANDKLYEVKEIGFFLDGRINYALVICNKNKDKSEYFCIDIFPFEPYYKSFSDEINRKELYFEVRKVAERFWKKCKRNKKFAYDFDKIRSYIAKITRDELFHGQPPAKENPALIASLDHFWEQPNYMIVAYNDVFPLQTINFEGIDFNCPNNIKEYLKVIYGENYMHFPPKFNPSEDRIDEYLDSLNENDRFID